MHRFNWVILFILLFYFNSNQAQNLIPNGDFELIEPDSFNLPNLVKDTGWAFTADGLMDWYNPTPYTFIVGSYPGKAESGNQFIVTSICYNLPRTAWKKQFRNYLTVRLSEKLQKDSI